MPIAKGVDRNEVVALAKQGVPYKEIARRLGIANGTISYHLKMAGFVKERAKAKRRYVRKQRVNGKPVDVLTGAETLPDRVLDAAWNALTNSEKAALIFGACSKQ